MLQRQRILALGMLLSVPVVLAFLTSVTLSSRLAWEYYVWGLDGYGELAYNLGGLVACTYFGVGAIGCGAVWIL